MSQLHDLMEEFARKVDEAYFAFSKAESCDGSEADMIVAKEIKAKRSLQHILMMQALCEEGIYSFAEALGRLYRRDENFSI